MKRSSGLMEGIYLQTETAEDILKRFDDHSQKIELWDKKVFAYVESRIRDEVHAVDDPFRKQIKAILKLVPAKRGPKPQNDMSPIVFYHLLRAEKEVLKRKTYLEAIEKHCEMRGYSADLVETFLTQYDEGRRSEKKKRGNCA